MFNYYAENSELELLPKFVTGKLEFIEIILLMENLSTGKRSLFLEMIHMIKIILIAPAAIFREDVFQEKVGLKCQIVPQ